MAASLSNSELEEGIQKILKDADLDSLSAKKVRRELEGMFDMDLTDRKKEIDELVMKFITEGVKNDKPEPKSIPTNKRERQNGHKKVEVEAESENKSDSDSDSGLDDIQPRPLKKKKGSAKVGDAELAKQLQEEEDLNIRGRRRACRKPVITRKPKADNKEKKEKRKGTSMYSRPCQLSPELADVMGVDALSRHEIVKKMWEIAKERDLQDPKNRQFMLCDDQLRKVFGRKRVRMFGMMKILTKHIQNMEPQPE